MSMIGGDFPSASGTPLWMICTASAIFPHAETTEWSIYSKKGDDLHAFLRHVCPAADRQAARLEALARIAPESLAHKIAIHINVDSLPIGGECEVAMKYHVDTDTAEIVGRDIERAYAQHGVDRTREIPGTGDYMGLVFEAGVWTLVLIDWKSGFHAGSAAKSWQMKTLAIMGARAYGVTRVRVVFYYVDEEGEVTPGKPVIFDEFALMGIAGTLQAKAEEHRAQLAEYRTGRSIPTVLGPHCTSPFECNALANCEGRRGLLLAALREPEKLPVAVPRGPDGQPLPEGIGALRSLAANLLEVLGRFVEQTDEHIRSLPEGAPVIRQDEVTGAWIEVPGKHVDKVTHPEAVHVYLDGHYGAQTAEAAAPMVRIATKGSIEAAVADYARRNGRKIGEEKEAAVKGLREIGAIERDQQKSSVKFIPIADLTRMLAGKQAA